MRKVRKFLGLFLAIALLAAMCMSGATANAADSGTRKEVVIYFANWNVYGSQYGEVKDLPWEKVSYINHAFWKIKPEDGKYGIVSTDPWADTDPDNPRGHFAQYEEYTAKYPDVNVLISVGGWTCCGYFSEMALTQASRKTFIDSCIETLKTYPWLAGIDIDWEYPGVERAGGQGDEGCPVVGDDFTNYTSLLREMRQALDAEFGAGAKKLTVCSSVGVSTIAKQDVAAFAPYVDLINIMSYDMTGSYDRKTGHHAALYNTNANGHSTQKGVQYYLDKGVPASKINIGTPLYCHGWGSVTPDANGNVVGVSGSSQGYAAGDMYWKDLKALEEQAVAWGTPGWHIGYDTAAEAAYLYNDDPSSKYYKNFLTYESAQSLQAKLDYINSLGLAGLIVWESFGDSAEDNYPMISQMAKSMNVSNQEVVDNPENIVVMKKNETMAYVNGALYPTTEYATGFAALQSMNGTYVLPLRYIAEVNGMKVDYLGSGRTQVTNQITGEYLVVNRDSTLMTKYEADGTKITDFNAPQPITVQNTVTFAPMRIICEALGLGVSYQSTAYGSYVVVSTDTTIDAQAGKVLALIEEAYSLGL